MLDRDCTGSILVILITMLMNAYFVLLYINPFVVLRDHLSEGCEFTPYDLASFFLSN